MVVDNEITILENIKSCLKQEDLEVITVDNNRKAFEIMENDKENNFSLILISTRFPNSKTPAFFSMKPKSKSNIDTSTEENFLKKPFTKEELLEFIRKRI
jgi:DNA-binding NtrC family response regulator